MKKSLFVLVAAAAVLAGCQQENFSAFKADKADYTKGIKAVIAADETRTSVVADGDVYHVNWVSGDQIILQKDGGFNDFYVTEDSGMNTASFYIIAGDTIKFDGATPIQAYYPASYFSKNSSAIALPAVQGYSASGVINNPMFAETIPDAGAVPTFEFKNLCGVLKINATSTVAGAAVKSISLKADQGMSGKFSVIDGAAVIVDDTEGVTLLCDEAVALSSTPTAFYIVVPANKYTNLEITVNTTDAKKQTLKLKADKTLSIERSKIYEADFAFNNFEDSGVILGGVCTLGAGSDINVMLKSVVDPSSSYNPKDKNKSGDIYGPTKIVFSPRDPSTVGVDISDPTSDCAAYASYNSGTGILTIASAADEFQLGTDGSFLFSGFYDVKEIVGLNKLFSEYCENMTNMFTRMMSLERLDLSSFKTYNVTTMEYMFVYCQNLKEINLSSFNTESVENFHGIFYHCESIENIDCSSFNTENATDMSYMFSDCYKLKSVNVKSFDTSNVTTFDYFFEMCHELTDFDISGFDTSAATKFYCFFDECYAINGELVVDFDTSSATSLGVMFWGCCNVETLKLGEYFDISNNPGMKNMFLHMDKLKDMWLPACFIPSNGMIPDNLFAYITSYDEMKGLGRTGRIPGSLTIHCTQQTAEWLATTSLRWLPSGYNPVLPVSPIPVNFLDLNSGAPMFVTWPAN